MRRAKARTRAGRGRARRVAGGVPRITTSKVVVVRKREGWAMESERRGRIYRARAERLGLRARNEARFDLIKNKARA